MEDTAVFQIRRSTPADVEAIVRVAQSCFGASAWGAAHFAPHPSRVTLVADAAEQGCIGYSVLELAADQAELQAIAVSPSFRRRHIGSALLEAVRVLARERGMRTMFLEVRESNALAQEFYRRFGFAPCGRRPAYYRMPEEAALVMSAEL